MATSAGASDVDAQRFGELARAAAARPDDAAAMGSLRSVDRVDGRAVDVAAALDGAQGRELASRLRALAGHGSAAGRPGDTAVDPRDGETSRVMDAVRARREAADILSQRRYRPSAVPQPFRGLLQRIGDTLERWLAPVFDRIPGPGWLGWVLVALVAVAIGAVVAVRLGRRRSRRTRLEEDGARRSARVDARALLRAADEAEAAGDLQRAIRLRFRAGLIGLDRAGVIDYRPSITTGEVSRSLHLDVFDEVASSFEEVVYGEREPASDDVELSTDGWTRVRAGVGS